MTKRTGLSVALLGMQGDLFFVVSFVASFVDPLPMR